MKRFLCAFVSCLVVAAVPVAADAQFRIEFRNAKKDDKIDKDKLVGAWDVKKLAPGLGFPIEGLMGKWEFKKDGSLDASFEGEVQGLGKITGKLGEGKYEVDGNKLTITFKQGEQETTYKTMITKLTDKEFQTKDEKGKVCEFTKKTDK
jgi:uncharacterized protein (TIGR03066 family)